MTLNKKVLDFAQAAFKAKQRIYAPKGQGECWDLAEQALAKAGAKTSTQIMGRKLGPNSNYIWGTPVTLGSVKPGDIIQFRNHYFKADIYIKYANGSSWRGWKDARRSHHTAIVEKVLSKGKIIVLEQNQAGVKKTDRNTVYFKNRVKFVETKGTETHETKITVSGKVWFYRPTR